MIRNQIDGREIKKIVVISDDMTSFINPADVIMIFSSRILFSRPHLEEGRPLKEIG